MKNSLQIKKVGSCNECPFGYTILENILIKCIILEKDIHDSSKIPKDCPLRTKKIIVTLK